LNQLVNHPKLIEQCKRLSEKLQLTGIFGFQFLENQQGELFFLECNPRIQGTMHATILGGVNLIEYAVLNTIGKEVKVTEPNWATRFYRIEGGYAEHT
jgi:biotin carboxylase